MVALVYRSGAVHDMAVLDMVLSDQHRQRLLLMHIDTVLWSLGRAQYKEYPIQPFCQMLEPLQHDDRTGREIVDDLAEKFRARIAKRGGQA